MRQKFQDKELNKAFQEMQSTWLIWLRWRDCGDPAIVKHARDRFGVAHDKFTAMSQGLSFYTEVNMPFVRFAGNYSISVIKLTNGMYYGPIRSENNDLNKVEMVKKTSWEIFKEFSKLIEGVNRDANKEEV